MGKKIDLTGRRFGRLVVICECGRSKHGRVLWKCRCDCGNECIVNGGYLTNGDTKSCGCLKVIRLTTHGLNTEHKKLCKSVQIHFKVIRDRLHGYSRWTLDPRYSDDSEGVIQFCKDLIALQPEMCARYEKDSSLEMDKDNGNNVFCPECISFISASENRSKHYNNHKLPDGTPLTVFCRRLGIPTRKAPGVKSSQYNKYERYFRHNNGAVHPELIKKANELVCLYTKTLKLLQLLEDVRLLRACV